MGPYLFIAHADMQRGIIAMCHSSVAILPTICTDKTKITPLNIQTESYDI